MSIVTKNAPCHDQLSMMTQFVEQGKVTELKGYIISIVQDINKSRTDFSFTIFNKQFNLNGSLRNAKFQAESSLINELQSSMCRTKDDIKNAVKQYCVKFENVELDRTGNTYRFLKNAALLYKLENVSGVTQNASIALNGEYRGSLVNGVPNGRGRCEYPSGDVYVGNWCDGNRQGKGTYTFKNGDNYKGSWLRGKRHGEGVFLTPKGCYEGRWQDDVPHGYGTYTYADGKVYRGNWQNGKKHGNGTETTLKGTVYKGSWINGKLHGKSTCTHQGIKMTLCWNNGRPNLKDVKADMPNGVYKGGWDYFKPQGRGTFEYKSGRKYEGDWECGNRQGQGTFTWTDGSKYEGGFDQDLRHGKGVFTMANGEKYAQTWELGKLKEQRLVVSAHGEVEVPDDRTWVEKSTENERWAARYRNDQRNRYQIWAQSLKNLMLLQIRVSKIRMMMFFNFLVH